MNNEVITLHLEGKSLREIQRITGFDRKKVSIFLKEQGLNIKARGVTTGSKYDINLNAFKTIDNEQSAYWLGFIMADGCVTKHNHCLDVVISEKDKEHLEKLRMFLAPDRELKYRKSTNSYRFSLYSKEMVEDLERLGCVQNKSLILKFPCIPQEHIHHFMRGYFDGDGTVGFYNSKWKPQANVEILGTEEFLDSYVDILMDYGLPRNPYRMHGQAYGYRFGGNNNYQKFVDFLYKDATIYLERKLKIPAAHLKSGELLEHPNV